MEHAEPRRAGMARTDERTARAEKVRPDKIRIEQHSAIGLLWFAGWLFSIGFLQLSFWKGAVALLIWPYYIGAMVGPIALR